MLQSDHLSWYVQHDKKQIVKFKVESKHLEAVLWSLAHNGVSQLFHFAQREKNSLSIL